jgi:hypothetical protein
MDDYTGESMLEMSDWGAPMTHDGALPTDQVLFVESVDDITEDGWKYMEKTTQLNWVIIPYRTQKYANR